MRIAAVQLAAGLDTALNRRAVSARLAEVPTGTDLVVLPEATMCDFGPPDSDLGAAAEPLDGPFVGLLGEQARRLGATVIGGMFERRDDGELPYNTLVVLGSDGGLISSYRKIHLYDSFGYCESDRLSAGPIEPVIVRVAERTVGLMTCYDLRFPELARALVDDGADLLAVPAAWVAGDDKLHHWRTLLAARAIENTVDVVAAAQGGSRYTGHSLVVDTMGSIVVEAASDDRVIVAELDAARLQRARHVNPSLANRRMGRAISEGST